MYKPSISSVKVNGINNPVIVPITSEAKPELTSELIEKWQKMINLVAQIIGVPAGLIMKVTKEDMEVFLKSDDKDNPYEENEKAPLLSGLYCETVIGSNDKLLVPDARLDEDWKNNPDVKLDMISYLGLPIKWPDSEVFGTICVLDSKTNSYSALYEDFLKQAKTMLEQDLELLTQKEIIENTLSKKELALREMSHRLKNNLNSLLIFLRLKSERLNNSDTDELLHALSARIQVLVSIQETILGDGNEKEINLKEYLGDVAYKILELSSEMDIKLNLTIDPIVLNVDEALLTLQIILELISNSVKHAFKKIDDKSIGIKISDNDEKTFILEYEDNGPGLEDDFESCKDKTLGLQLISAFTEQMCGNLEYEKGVNYKIKLTLSKKVYCN